MLVRAAAKGRGRGGYFIYGERDDLAHNVTRDNKKNKVMWGGQGEQQSTPATSSERELITKNGLR